MLKIFFHVKIFFLFLQTLIFSNLKKHEGNQFDPTPYDFLKNVFFRESVTRKQIKRMNSFQKLTL